MKKLLGSFCMLLMWAGTAQGLFFEAGGSYHTVRHDRFLLVSTNPDAPVPNPTFLLAPYEDQLRGVGWQATHLKKKVALISPQHFLTAKHFKATGSITFLDVTGTLRTFVVSRITEIEGDVAIGTLAAPIPEEYGINPFPVASISGDGPEGRVVYYVGNAPNSARFAVGRTGFLRASRGTVDLDSILVRDDDLRDRVRGITGDSGSPSFFLMNGELVLIGHHYSSRQDALLGLRVKAVNAHLASSGYALDLRREPGACGSGASQGAVMTLALVGWRQRRRRGMR